MSGKTIPFSVRLSQEDAEFIAKLEVRDASTPSDKIRSIISKAREDASREYNYRDMLEKMQDMVMPSKLALRTKEMDKGEHSELLANFAEWLVETNAFFVVTPQEKSSKFDNHKFEDGVAKRIFILFERIMRMGVTDTAPCYNKKLIKEKMAQILELATIINQKEKVEA